MNRMMGQGATLLLLTCCAIVLGSCGSGAVGSNDPLAGAPLAISPAVADLTPNVPTTFTITGGKSGYTAFSSNNAVLPVSATVTGSTFTVTPTSVNADTAVDITVRDSANTTVTAKATIKAGTPLAVSPATANLFADLPTTFTVTGGRAGYTAFSSDNAVLPITAAVTGSTFTVVPKAVTADTAVDITVRDVANTSVTAKATVKPSALLNQITFTPFGPTATGCGTNALCSGGDAQMVVKAVQNGVVLRNRAIRFDVFQGGFQLVTPSNNVLVPSLIINTDEQGEAVVRITANVGATTQVATIQTTDVTTGLIRRYNFTIVQQLSGAGILSTLPSGAVTITGAKGFGSADGSCPVGATVDYYVYGGTPPYTAASPLSGVATVVPPNTVSFSGGRFTAQVNGCGKVAFIVTDASGRTVETSTLETIQGAKGDSTTVTAPDSISVSPQTITMACRGLASVSVTGQGTFRTSFNASNQGFAVSSQTTIPNTVTFQALTGGTISTPIQVFFIQGATAIPVIVNITGIVGGMC